MVAHIPTLRWPYFGCSATNSPLQPFTACHGHVTMICKISKKLTFLPTSGIYFQLLVKRQPLRKISSFNDCGIHLTTEIKNGHNFKSNHAMPKLTTAMTPGLITVICRCRLSLHLHIGLSVDTDPPIFPIETRFPTFAMKTHEKTGLDIGIFCSIVRLSSEHLLLFPVQIVRRATFKDQGFFPDVSNTNFPVLTSSAAADWEED